MDGKVSITITTDKPVKIRVTPDDGSAAGKEAQGLNRLLTEVKGGNGHVAKNYESRKTAR